MSERRSSPTTEITYSNQEQVQRQQLGLIVIGTDNRENQNTQINQRYHRGTQLMERFVKILSYGQIISLLRRDNIKISGVTYSISPELKAFVEDNIPPAESVFVGGNFLLVAKYDDQRDAGEIVGFAPGNPPDPGMAP